MGLSYRKLPTTTVTSGERISAPQQGSYRSIDTYNTYMSSNFLGSFYFTNSAHKSFE